MFNLHRSFTNRTTTAAAARNVGMVANRVRVPCEYRSTFQFLQPSMDRAAWLNVHTSPSTVHCHISRLPNTICFRHVKSFMRSRLCTVSQFHSNNSPNVSNQFPPMVCEMNGKWSTPVRRGAWSCLPERPWSMANIRCAVELVLASWCVFLCLTFHDMRCSYASTQSFSSRTNNSSKMQAFSTVISSFVHSVDGLRFMTSKTS